MRLSDYYDVIATETDFRARSPEELRDLLEEREQILMIEWRVAPDSMRAVRPRLDSLPGFIAGLPMKPATNSLAGLSYTSCGGANCCSRPLRMTAIRSDIVIASSWSWVT